MAIPLKTIWSVEDLQAAFGKRVRELRKGLGLSHWTYVSAVERGLRTPGLDVIGRLANALAVSPAELFRPLTGRYRARRRKASR